MSVRTLEVTEEDRAEVTPAADAIGSSCSSQALIELDISRGRYWMMKSSSDPPSLHGKAVVLEPMVWVGLTVVLGDVRQRLEPPG